MVQDKIAPLVNEEDEIRGDILSSFGLPSSALYRTRFEAEIRGKEIIIYEVSCNAMPIMKFALCNEETREYLAYRWCFKGSIDDWHELRTGQLRDLADRYCPTLGTDDFYELW